jgi:RNA polymerase sigma-70 factor (ECF subfamily)
MIPPMSNATDLIAGMSAGDEGAFVRFYERYAALVHPLILRIVRDPRDAAEVVQEVFWECWQGAAGYDPARGTPEAWIFTRARTRAIDRARSVRRRSETFTTSLDDTTGGPPAPGWDPAGAVADRSIVAGALAKLPDAQRQVIELAYYGGLTQTEIADRLGQPLGTVKTRMRTALERLRDVLRLEQA